MHLRSNISCLFCHHKVSKSDSESYKNHLEEDHKLVKHVYESISETFYTEDNLTSLKCAQSIIDNLDEFDENENWDEIVTNPFEDLLDVFRKSIDMDSAQSKKNKQIKFDCSKCEKSFERSTKLKAHMKVTHIDGKLEKLGFVDETDNVDDPKAYDTNDTATEVSGHEWATFILLKCRECHVKIASNEKENHLTEHHPSHMDVELLDVELQYQCLVCIANVEWNKESISAHLKSHKIKLDDYSKTYEVPIEKQIKKQTDLLKGEQDKLKLLIEKKKEKENMKKEECKKETDKQDKRKNQSEKNKVPCDYCDKLFSTNFGLQRHLKNEHMITEPIKKVIKAEAIEPENEKPSNTQHSCKICKFKSSSKGALTFHVSKYHEKKDNGKCCSKNFQSKWELFVHLQGTHKEDKDIYNKFQIWPGLEKYL